jgi:hypothetical protein
MDEMFEEMLAICLDRLSDGDDVESCVADFPECPDLRPLLEIAAALSASTASGSVRAARQPTRLVPWQPEQLLRPTG